MAGTNFLQWNPTSANQETDSQYASDSARTGGATTGSEFASPTANKLFYQTSTFVTAFAQALVNKGYSPNDSSLSTLEGVLANVLTSADAKTNLTVVNFSTTPSFNAASTNGFDFTLSGNVTGSTLANTSYGQIITLRVNQQGSYSFVYPTNVLGGLPIPASGSLTNGTFIQQFIVLGDGNAYPLTSEIAILISEVAALTSEIAAANPTTIMRIVTGTRSFNTVYQNTTGFRLTVAASAVIVGGVGQGIDCYGNVSAVSASLPSSGSNGQTVAANSVTNSGGQTGVTFVVPPGYYYSFTWDYDGSTPTPSISFWTEWVN